MHSPLPKPTITETQSWRACMTDFSKWTTTWDKKRKGKLRQGSKSFRLWSHKKMLHSRSLLGLQTPNSSNMTSEGSSLSQRSKSCKRKYQNYYRIWDLVPLRPSSLTCLISLPKKRRRMRSDRKSRHVRKSPQNWRSRMESSEPHKWGKQYQWLLYISDP